MNLGSPDTPTSGMPAAQPHDDTGARVYDLPPTSPASAERPFGNPLPPSAVNAPSVPQFSVPQYTPPEGASGTVILPQQPTSNAALISMILGIVSLALFVMLLCTIFLSPISAVLGIPAVILGHNARKEIRASGGRLGGEGMAKAGLIMGWINIGLSVVAAIGICGFIASAALS